MSKSTKALAITMAICGATALTPAYAKTLEVQSVYPNNMLYQGESSLRFAEQLEAVTGGDLKVKVFSANELVPSFEVFDAVSSGAIEAGWDWTSYWGSKIPVANLIGAMPFGPQGEVFVGWMYQGGGLELLREAYAPYDVVPVPCHLTAPEPGGWFNVEINEPGDLKGLSMRIGGLGAKVVEKLGVTPLLIPGGEVYLALERGRIDAAEFSHPSLDRQLGLPEVGKYYYFPGWHQPGSWNSLLVNKTTWEGLTDAQRAAIETTCQANVLWSLYAINALQGDILVELEKEGVEVREFPETVMAALKTATDETLAEQAEQDELFKRALDSINAYVASVDVWNAKVLPRK
ncbi:TRAP transporter substrate-binding protein [Microbaculum marinisediminis]|uniref:TRAP transporter substrate-binding protein n=1 Tax=Microbaculum marinisediminis TaxID=2931392 RepID=A0AAW5QXI0_9HYPH|nr:TRAP transporter substrate-binding protein [Microbaculum sp. A6E488]MCT8971378.1 TRAP transporter substrate-binding protein [Microbaculum sp. A6E488]